MMFLGARMANTVTTISDFLSNQAMENWGISSKKIKSVGTGLDEVFCALDPPKNVEVPTASIEFISVGRLALAQKPLDIMAEALAGLPFVWNRWTIIGSGPDEGKLKSKLRDLGILEKTVFAGTMNSAEISSSLSKSAIVLLPSYYESFFITCYEAVAKGRIVVTNDVADVKKYFANDPSVVIARDVSCEAYRDAVGSAVERFSLLQSGAANIVLKVKQDYNWHSIADRFLQAFDFKKAVQR